MTAATGDEVLPVTSTPSIAVVQTASKKAKQKLTSPWASLVAVVLAVLWTLPTFGLLVTSFRPKSDIDSTGWWKAFSNPSWTLDNYREALDSAGLGTNFINPIHNPVPAVPLPNPPPALPPFPFAWIEFKGRA